MTIPNPNSIKYIFPIVQNLPVDGATIDIFSTHRTYAISNAYLHANIQI